MYEQDLTLNNLQWLICQKTQPNQTKPNESLMKDKTSPNKYPVYDIK